jgi:hypothetical protein
MATFETRVRRDGKTSIRARIRLKGARMISASFTRLTDTRRWAQQTEVAIQEGRYFKDAAAKRHTLAIDRYTVEVMPRKPRSASIQAPQLAWWRKEIGHLVLADHCKRDLGDAGQTSCGAWKQRAQPRTGNGEPLHGRTFTPVHDRSSEWE